MVGFCDPVIFDAVFGSSLSPVEIPVPLRDTTEHEKCIPLIINNLLLFSGFFAVFGGTGGIASRAAPEATLNQGMQKEECRMQKFGSKPPSPRKCRRLRDE